MSESTKPKIISEERAQYLLKKWSPILNAPLLTAEEYKVKLSTSIILESQEDWLSDEQKEKFNKK